jgi:hypothetical protein
MHACAAGSSSTFTASSGSGACRAGQAGHHGGRRGGAQGQAEGGAHGSLAAVAGEQAQQRGSHGGPRCCVQAGCPVSKLLLHLHKHQGGRQGGVHGSGARKAGLDELLALAQRRDVSAELPGGLLALGGQLGQQGGNLALARLPKVAQAPHMRVAQGAPHCCNIGSYVPGLVLGRGLR